MIGQKVRRLVGTETDALLTQHGLIVDTTFLNITVYADVRRRLVTSATAGRSGRRRRRARSRIFRPAGRQVGLVCIHLLFTAGFTGRRAVLLL